jgi:hypothetical protein
MMEVIYSSEMSANFHQQLFPLVTVLVIQCVFCMAAIEFFKNII